MKSAKQNRFNYITNELDYVNDMLTDSGFSELPDAVNSNREFEKMIVIDNQNETFWLADMDLKDFLNSLFQSKYNQQLHYQNTI